MAKPDLDALNKYIRAMRNVPFQWHSNDCFTFTNNAFRAMYGEGWADDWDGKYIRNGLYLKRDELRKVFGANTLEEAIDRKMKRVTHIPPKGSLVTTDRARRWVIGDALGIAIGTKAIFLGEKGVISQQIDFIKSAWIKA
jgi:hypothetical protein